MKHARTRLLCTSATVLLLGAAPAAADQYNYDALGRLKSVITTDGRQTLYSYDAAGNRTTVSVGGISNRHPTANDDAGRLEEGSGPELRVHVLGNDADVEGPLRIVGATAGVYGSVTPDGGDLVYRPFLPARFSATDVISYTVQDPGGLTDSAVFRVELANLPPQARSDAFSVPPNTAAVLDLLANDSDPGGDSIRIHALGQPSNGEATRIDARLVRYTPRPGFVGQDSFSYVLRDGENAEASATVQVSVDGVNHPPVAADIPDVVVRAGQFVVIDAGPYLTDLDRDPLSIVSAGPATRGGVDPIGGTSMRYSPTGAAAGSDTFPYTVTDGRGAASTARVTVNILAASGPGRDDPPPPPNRPPVAVNDQVRTDPDEAVAFDPRGNDSDPDGDPLSVVDFGPAAHGTVERYGTGLQYTPRPSTGPKDRPSLDQFTYTITDGRGATASAGVSISISEPLGPEIVAPDPPDVPEVGGPPPPTSNQAPIARDDQLQVQVGQRLEFDPRLNDSDPDGDPLYVVSLGDAAEGSVDFYLGRFVYQHSGVSVPTKQGSSSRLDSFTYTIVDGRGGTSTATAFVRIYKPIDPEIVEPPPTDAGDGSDPPPAPSNPETGQ
jgi:YD repeat-containing protein